MKDFFGQNFKWIITLAFLTGANVTTIVLAVESKIDKETAIQIVDTRLAERAYPLIEGKLTERDMIRLQADIQEIKSDIKKILNEKDMKKFLNENSGGK